MKLVKLHVGKDSTPFVVDKELICSSCWYFDRAFNGPYLEGHQDFMNLPADRPRSIELMIDFLYHDRIQDTADANELLDLYYLAEKICFDRLSDAIMDQLRTVFHRDNVYADILGLAEIYDNTHEHSSLRRFFVHLVVFELWEESAKWKGVQARLELGRRRKT